MNPDYQFTTAELLARAWTRTLIRRFLPEADGRAMVNHWANFSGTSTYLASRVWAIEQSEEFEAAFLRSWKGRMKKRDPKKCLQDLRKSSVPVAQVPEDQSTRTSEQEEKEEDFLPGPNSGWIPVATKVDGHTTWEDGWKPVEYMFEGIRYFEQIPHHNPAWDQLLHNLTLLQPLRSRWNELSRFDALEDLGCFWGIVDPGEFSASTYLYFDESWLGAKRDELFQECTELTRRLSQYEPLREFWQYMHSS